MLISFLNQPIVLPALISEHIEPLRFLMVHTAFDFLKGYISPYCTARTRSRQTTIQFHSVGGQLEAAQMPKMYHMKPFVLICLLRIHLRVVSY